MFTVRVEIANVPAMDWTFEYCADAWKEFSSAIDDAATVMALSAESGDTFNLHKIRMAYMIDVPGVEVEYANVTIA